jgi:hypothetical protein
MVFGMRLGTIRSGRAIGAVLLITVVSSGCASYTPALVRLDPSGADIKRAVKGDLAVSAEEFVTGQKSQVAFDTNLADEGVLPILIAVENNGREAFDVNIADVRLFGEKTFKLLPGEDAALRAQRATAVRALGWSVIVPIITIPIAIGASAIHTSNVNQQIVRDFTTKALADGAVLPNKERSGFVFFESDGKRKDLAGLTLQVTVRNSNTGEPTSIELAF